MMSRLVEVRLNFFAMEASDSLSSVNIHIGYSIALQLPARTQLDLLVGSIRYRTTLAAGRRDVWPQEEIRG